MKGYVLELLGAGASSYALIEFAMPSDWPFMATVGRWWRSEGPSLPDSSTKMLSSRIDLLDKEKARENVPGTWGLPNGKPITLYYVLPENSTELEAFPDVSGISRPVRQLMGKPLETTHFAYRWRRLATWGFANGAQAARVNSLTIAAGGLRAKERSSFKRVFSALSSL